MSKVAPQVSGENMKFIISDVEIPGQPFGNMIKFIPHSCISD